MNQPNIKQIIKDYKLVFPCPHCEKVINDDHFNKEHKAFNYISEQVRELTEKHFLSQKNEYRKKWLKELEVNRAYEDLPAVKELKVNLEKKAKRIAELQSSEYIESLERVKKLVVENQELRQQNQNFLLAQNRPIKRKGELFEQYVAEELSRVFDDKDKISKLTQLGKKADFLQEVLTETEPRQVAGRIVYETKDTEKWENDWVNKLENDMAKLKADFGIIIATCENGKPLRCLDPRKKIYVSDETNFIYIAKIMRDSLIQKHNLLENIDSDKEKRLKNLDEWISETLPQYFLRLEKELIDLNKNANSISRAAESIKNLEINIRKIILEEVRTELSNL